MMSVLGRAGYREAIALVVIALAALVMFGVIFSYYEKSIGIEAAAAAFSAVFIILSTKALIGQESRGRLHLEEQIEKQRDQLAKQRTIFDTRLEAYRRMSSLLTNALSAGVISENQLFEIRKLTLELHLSADSNTLKELTNVAQVWIEAFVSAVDTDMFEVGSSGTLVHLSPDQQVRMWSAVAKLTKAARLGLELDEIGGQPEFIENLQGILDRIEATEQRIGDAKQARSELEGGLVEWVSIRGLSGSTASLKVSQVQEVLDVLLSISSESKIKITKTQITWSTTRTMVRRRVVLYIGGFSGGIKGNPPYLICGPADETVSSDREVYLALLADVGFELVSEKKTAFRLPLDLTQVNRQGLFDLGRYLLERTNQEK